MLKEWFLEKGRLEIKVLFIFGTRPEAIKLAPLIKKISMSDKISTIVCSTGQHSEMLEHVLDFFDIHPDYSLNVMVNNQTLSYLSSRILTELSKVLDAEKPQLVIVQGDTTTAYLGALSGFYYRIPVAHIEAGLRSTDKYSPFPEEINRILISHLTSLHFCPTKAAAENLKRENINENIFHVGNTVIDALLMGIKQIEESSQKKFYDFFNFLDMNKRIVLITAHRRESFGKPFEEICNAIKKVANKFKDVQFIYPVHLNPSVQKPVFSILSNIKNVFLIEPLDYEYFIWLLNKSYFVLTDSGGIQEEAPSLAKPVLVMRNVTERMEGIEAESAVLVGTNEKKIYNGIKMLLNDTDNYQKMARVKNPYGDGKSSEKIMDIILRILND